MNWRALWVPTLFCILVCAGRISSQTSVPKSDTQNWNDVYVTVPLSKRVDFVMQGTLRVGNTLEQPVDERWGIGWVYKVNKYLSLNPFYFHREARPPHGKQESEDRVTLGATFQRSARKFILIDRNWFERRWRQPQVDAWRYRNRMRIERPFQIKKKKFFWFVSDEAFYDWSAHDWVRNRANLGAGQIFSKHLSLELYYMRQNDGRTKPGDINILGTSWRFRL